MDRLRGLSNAAARLHHASRRHGRMAASGARTAKRSRIRERTARSQRGIFRYRQERRLRSKEISVQFQVSCISRDECSAEEWEARVDLAAASTGRYAWPKRGNLQSPDPSGPWQTRLLLPDSVWHALVGGQGFFVHGGRHKRWRSEARGR